MRCPSCGTELPNEAMFCPSCGAPAAATPGQPPRGYAPPPQPASYPGAAYPGAPQPPRTKGLALIIAAVVIGVLLIGCVGTAGAVWWLRSRGAAPASETPAASAQPTATTAVEPSQADDSAAEQAVVDFYAAINAGDFERVKTLVTPDTASGMDPGMFEGWSPTTFEIARSVVDGDAAKVFGRESERAFGSEDLGVRFSLERVSGTWLIASWNAVDEATVNGTQASSGQGVASTDAQTRLDETSARGTVSALLDARRAGDANRIRSLTTAGFQRANGDVWLDGIKTAPYFTRYTFIDVKPSGAALVVRVKEEWNSGDETASYTVVDENGTVLVDTWTSEQ